MTMKLARQNFTRDSVDVNQPQSSGASNAGSPKGSKARDWARDSFRTDSFREQGDARLGHITSLAAAADGSVWVAFSRGRLERYTALGMLMISKVSPPSPPPPPPPPDTARTAPGAAHDVRDIACPQHKREADLSGLHLGGSLPEK